MGSGYHCRMTILRVAATAAFLALSLAACNVLPVASAPPPAPAAAPVAPPPVLLVSIDGFRADHLDLGITPNLQRLANGGVRAEWMNASYPTLTFPNHYTVVTGLHPDHHGIVHNTMSDPVLGEFHLGNREALGDGRWWGGEPIWVGAEKAGLPTATLFWPGSEAAIQGVRPTRWLPFDYDLPMDERVDIVLGWLAEPLATRPRFATLYFEHLDKASHAHGPDSPEAHAAIVQLDAAIGRLLAGLSTRDAVNLVIVSDHGMTAAEPGTSIALEDMVAPEDAKAITYGQSLGFAPLPGRTAAAEQSLLGRHERFACWRKGELPTRWHYGTHARIPAIVCQMDEGWDARPRATLARRKPTGTRGAHGYDPALPSMHSLFIAHGPAFRARTVLPAFDSVDVYPLLARLVGITPAANDGDAATLAPALAEKP